MPEPNTQCVDTAAPDYQRTTIVIGEKYTVAVMGAEGVGKTVFLGSYFHMTKNLGMGKHSVFENNQDSWFKVKTMLDTLFVKKEPVSETSRHNDLGFSVPDLMMEVDLKSVPDGDTQNVSGWVDKVVSQIRRSDGVICFISGEDLILHPDEMSPDNTVFMKAISMFQRKRTWSLGRTNIPVWFIVTKGDTIPDVSEDELKQRVISLIKKSADSSKDTAWVDRFFEEGSNAMLFKVEAMGKWPSANTLPEEFQPKNIVEPMDMLFEKMIKSRKKHSYITECILLVPFSCLLYFLNKYFQIGVGFLAVATVFFLCFLRFLDFHTKYPGELRTRFNDLFN